MIGRLAALAVALATPATVTGPAPRFTSLLPAFDRTAMRTVGLSDAERIAAFRREVAPLLPDFYRPNGTTPERYWARVAKAIGNYPAQRQAILAASALVERSQAGAGIRFRRAFPDYRATTPVYLVHSLGELDGGTRTIGGHNALLFGADVIAQLHDAASIGPLFDHELFHTYHARWFADCPKLWCLLWSEGLAVYVTATLNPGADDRALLLAQPAPIRAAIDRDRRHAVETVRAALDAEDEAEISRMFSMGSERSPFPQRYGYYVGMLVAADLGRNRNLVQLAHLNQAQARPLIEGALDRLAAASPR